MYFCLPPRSSAHLSKIYDMKIISVICVIWGCLYLAGCESHSSTPSNTVAAKPINTPDGMIDYLRGRNIPALKAVEPLG